MIFLLVLIASAGVRAQNEKYKGACEKLSKKSGKQCSIGTFEKGWRCCYSKSHENCLYLEDKISKWDEELKKSGVSCSSSMVKGLSILSVVLYTFFFL